MIAAVILAAGASRRMGEPKALVRTSGGSSFAERIADSARAGGVDELVMVVGPPHGDTIRRALSASWRVAENPHPERGMLSSVQAGVRALGGESTAALVWPVDVPYVRAETVRAIVDAAPSGIIIPQVGARGGHPIRIPRSLFAEVLALDPASGLRALVEEHAAEVVRLPVEDDAVLIDVDTPADLSRAQKSRTRE